jgi:hypothetical protein
VRIGNVDDNGDGDVDLEHAATTAIFKQFNESDPGLQHFSPNQN